MEPFVPFYDARDLPVLDAYSADPEWRAIYEFLRTGYWHVTSVSGWAAIQQSGAIQPNRDGRFPMRFGFNTRRSYGFIHRCVALFDFETPSEETVIREWGKAWDVLVNADEDQVLLHFDRSCLEPRIIPSTEGWQRSDKKVFGCIPHLEVWYPDDITLDAITGRFRIPMTARFEFLHATF